MINLLRPVTIDVFDPTQMVLRIGNKTNSGIGWAVLSKDNYHDINVRG